MGSQATHLSDVKVKAAKPKEKDYILTNGNGLQMRVRSNGSKLWNFNYIHPVTKKRVNMGLGTFPEVSLALGFVRKVGMGKITSMIGWRP
ncbi:integrase arm-type DNA-binding domain-containing protein, partial [Pseudomonas sp. RIT-PI-AD]|uniref:integrase arm-type DNA-binding domain-containing protein n=1 Tax=Pseudomonas sp. RIT-PI-AD TaxID=3035294 RepID=UPI0021D8FEA8